MVEERLPPHDAAAEEAVLGSLLIDPEALFTVATQLAPEDFFVPQNRLVYEACLAIDSRRGTTEEGKREGINQVTVAQELARRGLLIEAGGAAHLSHVVSTVPTSLHAEYYAQVVKRLSVMRSLINAAGQIARIGYEAGPDPDAALAQAEDILFKLRQGRDNRDFVAIRDVLDKYLEGGSFSGKEKQDHVPFVLTGYAAIDDILGGFQRSDLIIIGARPSIGKTSLALCIARNAAVTQKACVAFFSMEMGRESLAQRLIADEADVDSHRLRLGHLAAAEEKRVVEATGMLSEAPFYIDDSPQLRVVEMRSKVRRLHNERGVDLVVLDYLQLVAGDRRNDNRVQEVSEITRSLKALARELNVPVCVVSQLSRAVMGRGTHRPQLSDLRESGSIEQDADVVLFIHRDDYYTSVEEWGRDHDLSKEP
ncbi:MAG: replicative DNA helicase, partial [Chloroflexi bacterium]|nr:replicative DNA helicase [Chloroflexota bacterium]